MALKPLRFTKFKPFKVFIFFLVLLTSIFPKSFISPASALTCNAAGSNVTITALHRDSSVAWGTYKPFYADASGGSDRTKNSAYAGYSIDGSAVSSISDLWIQLSSFATPTVKGSVVLGLAANQSSAIPVRTKFRNSGGAEDATKRVAYFYLTSTSSSPSNTDVQTFTVKLFNGNPSLGGVEICSATDGFSGVEDINSASSNKVTSVSASATTLVLGSNFEITALGQTGTMGSGVSSDRDSSGNGAFSISPAIGDSWNADAFTLTGISYLIDDNGNGSLLDDTTKYNSLRFYPTYSSNRNYKIVYSFAARETAGSTLFQPAQSIASGANVKYTGTYSGTAANTYLSIVKNSLSLNKALKSITSAGTSGSNSLYDLTYELTLKNNGNVTSTFDYIQDNVTLNTSTTGGTFASPIDGATLTLNAGSTLTPVTKASISGSVLTLNFNGPITLSASGSGTINYTVRVSYPTSNASMPISNSATGYIGSETVTASTGVNAVSINIKTTYTLTINYAANGYITVDAAQVDGTSCSSQAVTVGNSVICTFYKGTALTLSAVSASSTISSWGSIANGNTATNTSNTGDCAISGAYTPCTFVIQGNSIISPTFAASYTVTVTGVSYVSVSDGGLPYSCSAGTCTKTYASGTTKSLTFTPDTGYSITSITSNAGTRTPASTATFAANYLSGSITVNSDFTITVVAALPQYGLDVSASTGGSVSSNGSYIVSCSSDANGATGTCGALINTDTSVTLTATVSSGYYFGGWSGDGSCTGTSLTCTFTMNQNRSVIATFTSSPSLVVTVIGSGSVSANSGAISSCDSSGLNCSGSYTLNSSVTLTATPSSGYQVTWSGACSGTSSTCSVTMNASKAVTATFTIITYSLTLTVGANGSVSANTGAVSACTSAGGTCSGTYNSGTAVTLTATPSSGYKVSSWTGDCSGTSTTCSLNMTENKSAGVTFVALTSWTITADDKTYNIGSSAPTLTGSASPSGGLSGSLTCNAYSSSDSSYATPLTVDASLAPGSYVIRCSGTAASGYQTTPSYVNGTLTVRAAPTVTTVSAASVSTNSATLRGTINANNASTTTTFCWGINSDLASCDTVTASPSSVTGTTNTNITYGLTGLSPSTTYYFRAIGSNGIGGTINGSILNFTTGALGTYTVTYDLNTGSGTTPSSQSVTTGNSITLDSGSGISKTNSGFIGWSESNSTDPILASPYTPASSLTVYAHWITTTAATSVTTTTATLNGTSTLTLTNPKFCYSTAAPVSPAVNFNPSTCGAVSASGTYSAAITGLTAGTTYHFQISGTVGSTVYYGAVLTFATSAVASTYSITVNAGTGGTANSSAATVTSGGNVTLTATPASGYTFSSWTCSGGGSLNSTTANPATLSNIASNATCTANFTRTGGGGGGGIQVNPGGGTSNQNVKILVQKVSGGGSNRPSGSGNSAGSTTQAGTTTITTTVVTQDGSTITTTTTGITNSNASSTGVTNSTGGVITALTNLVDQPGQAVNGAKVEAVSTTAETRMVVDANVPPSVVVNRGQDNKVQVQAVNGWTGRVSVAVVNEDDPSDVKSYLEVVINPLPVTNVEIKLPERGKKPEINFDPSPSQIIEYEIQLNGKTVCQGTETSCALPKLIGPKSKVDIITRGEDDTQTVTRLPSFTPPRPIPALTVYFPLASSQLTRSEIKKLDKFVKEVKAAGFTRVVLEGHTDVQGARSGYNNLALSNSRAKATADYLRKFLKVKFAKDQFAETRPAVEGSGETVYQNNRRTEVSVW